MTTRRALALVLALALGLAVLPAAAERPSGPPAGTSSHDLTLVGETETAVQS